jgi:type IV pilus biogenesis protein CpaD/CtpE
MLRLSVMAVAGAALLAGCASEGPMRPAGLDQAVVTEREVLRPPSPAARILTARAIARVTGAPPTLLD